MAETVVTHQRGSALRWGLCFAIVHGALAVALILIRVTFWGSFGWEIGRAQRLIDFFAIGLVRRTVDSLASPIQHLHHATGLGIDILALSAEILAFVVYGGLVYFAIGYVSRTIWTLCARRGPT